ncbi:MAG: hypothetical protein ABH826_02230 [Patescibacteria group bacterium]
MKNMILFLGLFIIVGVSFYLGIYWRGRNQWTGFFYPDADQIEDQRTWILSPPLKSLEECRKWVKSIRTSDDIDSDYNCSQGCRFTTEYIGETVICKNKFR